MTETSSIATDSNRLLSVANGTATRTLTTDAAGNITGDDGTGVARTLGYNDRGRLISIAEGVLPVATYLHNALGERVKKDSGGGTTHYHYDQAGRLIAESDGTTGAATREYINLAGLPLALVVDIATSPTLQQVHADHLGAPQKMTDGAGALIWDASYTPYGLEDAITGTAANDQRFPGQLADGESGYHYNYFRTYDPSLGRYLQSDPIGLAGGLNRYAYAAPNPVNYTDPSGLISIPGFLIGDWLSKLKNRIGSCKVNPEFDPNSVRPDDNTVRSEGVDDKDGENNASDDPIPEDIEKAIDEIKSGSDRPNVRNPSKYENDGRGKSEVLPKEDSSGNPIDYTEHDANPKPAGKRRDDRRVVTGSDGSIRYTTDHYGNFKRVK